MSDFTKLMTKEAKAKLADLNNWRNCSPDLPPCAICKKTIKQIPLRAFKTIEIAFHNCCGFQEGMIYPREAILEWNKVIEDQCFSRPDFFPHCVMCNQLPDCKHVSDEEREDLKKYFPEYDIQENLDNLENIKWHFENRMQKGMKKVLCNNPDQIRVYLNNKRGDYSSTLSGGEVKALEILSIASGMDDKRFYNVYLAINDVIDEHLPYLGDD